MGMVLGGIQSLHTNVSLSYQASLKPVPIALNVSWRLFAGRLHLPSVTPSLSLPVVVALARTVNPNLTSCTNATNTVQVVRHGIIIIWDEPFGIYCWSVLAPYRFLSRDNPGPLLLHSLKPSFHPDRESPQYQMTDSRYM